eukprot:3524744-Heterocapsa_arctica.AAC.1
MAAGQGSSGGGQWERLTWRNCGRAGRGPEGWRCREITGPLGLVERARRNQRCEACGGERAGPRRGRRGAAGRLRLGLGGVWCAHIRGSGRQGWQQWANGRERA